MPVLSDALPNRTASGHPTAIAAWRRRHSSASAPLDAPQVPLALGRDALEARGVRGVARATVGGHLRIRAHGPRERLARRRRCGAWRCRRRARGMRALQCRRLLALLDPVLERRQPVDGERAFATRAVI